MLDPMSLNRSSEIGAVAGQLQDEEQHLLNANRGRVRISLPRPSNRRLHSGVSTRGEAGSSSAGVHAFEGLRPLYG